MGVTSTVKEALRLRELRELGLRAWLLYVLPTELGSALLDRRVDFLAPVSNFVENFSVDVPDV